MSHTYSAHLGGPSYGSSLPSRPGETFRPPGSVQSRRSAATAFFWPLGLSGVFKCRYRRLRQHIVLTAWRERYLHAVLSLPDDRLATRPEANVERRGRGDHWCALVVRIAEGPF